MFTVKIIKPSGEHQLYEAEFVSYSPFTNNTSEAKEKVEFRIPGDSTTYQVVAGSVYVMNFNGKTVADYYLGSGTSQNEEASKA
jgi:hypothetical protein